MSDLAMENKYRKRKSIMEYRGHNGPYVDIVYIIYRWIDWQFWASASLTLTILEQEGLIHKHALVFFEIYCLYKCVNILGKTKCFVLWN